MALTSLFALCLPSWISFPSFESDLSAIASSLGARRGSRSRGLVFDASVNSTGWTICIAWIYSAGEGSCS